MLRSAAAVASLLILFAGCGEDDEDAGGSAPPAGAGGASAAAELTVIVRPSGSGGPARERRIKCERVGPEAADLVCRALTAARLAPVAPATACAEIYGGPATARVTGTLRDARVDARFNRVNACEIARWDRNAALLGKVPLRP
jgi:hypothetical protein